MISIHPPRVGRDPLRGQVVSPFIVISIHPPRVGRDRHFSLSQCRHRHFNPPSPCGEGPGSFDVTHPKGGFQSTLPVWGGTAGVGIFNLYNLDFNPPSPCGEGRHCLPQFPQGQRISIHPPRVGRDLVQTRSCPEHQDFNPPSPCGEGRVSLGIDCINLNFNPPSPCGEGRPPPSIMTLP